MKRDLKKNEFVEHINKFMRQTVGGFTLVDNQLSKLDIILFALLKDMGKSEDVNCENCGESITRPVINGLPKNDECPACGENLIVDELATVEDWDNPSISNLQ